MPLLCCWDFSPGVSIAAALDWHLLRRNLIEGVASRLRHTARRLKEAEVAAIKEPGWSLRIPQEIYWWSLVRAGFDIVQKQTAILDRDLHLAGKPWRVLAKGARHIPVIKFPTVIDPVDPRRHGQMTPQTRLRLAAYAYLTNRVERGQSDWVIVMFGNGFQGIAVPIDESMMSLFATGRQTAPTTT